MGLDFLSLPHRCFCRNGFVFYHVDMSLKSHMKKMLIGKLMIQNENALGYLSIPIVSMLSYRQEEMKQDGGV